MHREQPIKRRNPSGKTVWIARYTAPDGRRLSAGTFRLKTEAQTAIDAAYDMPVRAVARWGFALSSIGVEHAPVGAVRRACARSWSQLRTIGGTRVGV